MRTKATREKRPGTGRIGVRNNALPLAEEKDLREKKEEILAQQLYSVVQETSMMNFGEARTKRRLANSLIWIWVNMKPDQVRRNIWIAMAANDVLTIKELSERTGVNTSNLSRGLRLKTSADFAKWNADFLYPIAQALRVRPELLLQANLTKTVLFELVNWHI